MDIKFVLKSVLDYLNDIKSPVMITHFNVETGMIHLSNNKQLNISELKTAADIQKYL